MDEGTNITFFIGLAAGLIWSACLVVSVLKGKIGSAIVGAISAVAIAIGWRIGSWNIFNPLVWVPVFAAMRLGRPDSFWAYLFYTSRPQKYARAVVRYDISPRISGGTATGRRWSEGRAGLTEYISRLVSP